MSYSIISTPVFKKEAKRLCKRYTTLIDELALLEKDLENNHEQGVDLGDNVYKIRIAIKSKGKGKSGGGRVITYIITEDLEVYLLYLYDKSELSNIDDKTLRNLINEIRALKQSK